MKLKKVLFFSLIFAALVFCISCGGKGDKYPDIDDDITANDDDADTTDTTPGKDDSDDIVDTEDNESDTEPDDDAETDDHNNIPDESHETDHDPIDDNDPLPQDDEDPDTDDQDDDDDEPVSDDDADSGEPEDEDYQIPEKEEPATICTGQDKCFNNKKQMDSCPASPSADFYGQDAQYANSDYCLSNSFSTTNDLVTDNITGLVWQRKLPTEGCPKSEGGAIICTKQEAIDYCSNLNYAGHSDWRLPTPEEYATIKNFGEGSAIAGSDYFPLPSTTSTIFWTTSSSLASSGKSWAVDFQTGETTEQDDTKASSAFYVRCVRGEELAKPDYRTFTENDEVIVYDETHNLKWTKTIGEEMIWKAALKHCEDLEYAGETDWRLPNINELASIIDYSRSNPASLFPGLTSPYLWSSTTYIGYPSSAWIVDMSSGTVQINNGKTVPHKVICVK
jgi:hypothetical protein